jgi:hypothetical protein
MKFKRNKKEIEHIEKLRRIGWKVTDLVNFAKGEDAFEIENPECFFGRMEEKDFDFSGVRGLFYRYDDGYVISKAAKFSKIADAYKVLKKGAGVISEAKMKFNAFVYDYLNGFYREKYPFMYSRPATKYDNGCKYGFEYGFSDNTLFFDIENCDTHEDIGFYNVVLTHPVIKVFIAETGLSVKKGTFHVYELEDDEDIPN